MASTQLSCFVEIQRLLCSHSTGHMKSKWAQFETQSKIPFQIICIPQKHQWVQTSSVYNIPLALLVYMCNMQLCMADCLLQGVIRAYLLREALLYLRALLRLMTGHGWSGGRKCRRQWV